MPTHPSRTGVRRKNRKERGQASVLIGMMMATFLLFFAFVINTGMLVNAKINLQNAADLAAYAGAAAQARQLDHIAYLNYEMRRQYKKFLFRYYVVGNMAQKTHPGNGGPNSGPRVWSPDGNPATNYGVPATCVIFNRRDNYCQVPSLRAIRVDGPSNASQLFGSFQQTLRSLEDVRKAGCKLISRTNAQLLAYWLYNTDPTLKEIEARAAATEKELQEVLPIIRGLAFGLGLVPREKLLQQRIKTLADYINQAPAQGVRIEQIQRMQNSEDAAQHERTILAFKSAYETLGGCSEADGCTFDSPSDIVMNEILPGGNVGANLIRLEPILASFDAHAVGFDLASENGTPLPPGAAPGTPADCLPKANPITAKNVPLGVYKDPSVLTYYAISLTAKAKIMFSPFGDMTLKAFAAAQPFGSRIGPRIENEGQVNEQLRVAKSSKACSDNLLLGCLNFIPNLPVKANDTTAAGWLMNDMIAATGQYLLTDSIEGGGIQMKTTIGPEDLERAYQAAMVPNPWERGKYQIPNDLVPDPMVRRFASEDKSYAFWAPIVSPAKPQGANELRDLIETMVEELSVKDPANSIAAAPWEAAMKDALKQGLNAYMTQLRQGAGEANESFHYARINDPYFSRATANSPPQPLNLPPEFMLRDPKEVRSSWSAVSDAAQRTAGRTGYSVKLVAFKTLLSPQGVTTDLQSGVWVNPPPISRELPDADALQH